jgi:hypothetical protein
MNFKPDALFFDPADSVNSGFLLRILPQVSAGETALRHFSAPGQVVPFP